MPNSCLPRRCLLLVEDDRMERETIVLLLEDAFDVVLAVSVATALVELRAVRSHPIDVVLLDYHLPDGPIDPVLAEADLRLIPVVLTSGDLMLDADLRPVRTFLRKPFSEKTLLSVLEGTRRQG